MKKSTEKTTLLNKLKSQQLEIIHLISINLINSIGGLSSDIKVPTRWGTTTTITKYIYNENK